MKNRMRRNVQRGFTLVELVVVVGIIGILSAMLIPNMIGSKDGAKAELLLKASLNISQNWMMISQKCGTTTDVSNSPVPASGKTIADVVFGGVSNVSAAYQTCYMQAKVIPMSEIAQFDGTVWRVQGFSVAFAGGGTVPLQTVYSGVPEELALIMVQNFSPSMSSLAASDSTSNVVRYGVAASGTRTVTVLRQIG